MAFGVLPPAPPGVPPSRPKTPRCPRWVRGTCGPQPDLSKKTHFIVPLIPRLNQLHHLKKTKNNMRHSECNSLACSSCVQTLKCNLISEAFIIL